ncbi:MAG: S41 family peptidase [Isosphaeraceae bacterium]
MERPLRRSLACVIMFSTAAIASIQMALADERSPVPSASAPKPPPGLAARVQEITDVVLENHMDPPARQQMILSGIKALYRATNVQVPPDLSRRVSAVATPDQLAALLADAWQKATASPIVMKMPEEVLLNGLLAPVPGGAELMTAKERKVTEQLEGNRYVGIHIALGMDEKEKLSRISEVFPGGPADRAGVKKDDLIEEIDGVATKDMVLRDAIERLRGEEGTDVTIKVRQPVAAKSRTMTITRGQLPHPTIQGIRKRPDGDWDLRFDGLAEPIGFLKISIEASTPHELRKMAQQLESQGARALILDLRGAGRTNPVHPAVLLADCLLDHGPIGRVRTARGETTYQADSDALFRGWPMVVLVDANTSGTAEWLAAALQDNHRATIVGTPTHGTMRGRRALGRSMPQESTGVRSRVSVGDGSWSIELTTGYLERGDGRALSPPDEDATGTPRDLPLQGRLNHEEIKTGVRPDYLVAVKPGPGVRDLTAIRLRGRAQEPAPPKVQEKTPQPVFSQDPLIEKAIQILREPVKKN